MADTHTKEQRSYNMSRIRSSNTSPELAVRKFIWSRGLRGYRLESKLPGKPDLYFGKAKLAVFIDGCFWHKCPDCYVRPKSSRQYWDNKIMGNVWRDEQNTYRLKELGIKVVRIWEHDAKKPQLAFQRIVSAL